MGRPAVFLATGAALGLAPALLSQAAVALVLLPFALLPFAVLAAHASPSRLAWTLYAALTVATAWLLLDFATSTASTAALGLLWLPVGSVVVAAVLTLVLAGRRAPTP